ncbi:nickel pincer cofactor biosynthesis protein LarB [Ectobacillus polymachus]|uniref:nickel pincer cofactor biosynthesis protein LarB n=1 Tax=Ectobacillus polymachus TaxID=1508806 RepID=UPI003A8422AE
MNQNELIQLMEAVKDGRETVDDAVSKLKQMPFEDLGYAKVDHHRHLRNGYPEVIYCEGKTIPQIQGIVRSLLSRNSNILGTRATKEMYQGVLEITKDASYDELSRCIVIKKNEQPVEEDHYIAVVCAGTSDIPVAEEAVVTAEAFGNRVERIYDVGVAGVHRLLAQTKKLQEAKVLIVIAGMEGALASVVGGLVDKPVIAVPTSVGYGANFHGLSALLTMLNSCASGVSVVNIDNGFGAAYTASMINHL